MKIPCVLLAVLSLGAATHARADSATITVTGKVLPGTCTVANVPVPLADIDAVDLVAGHDNGLAPLALTFSDCVGVGSIVLSFDGTDDAAQDGHWSNQAVSGGASGVAVVLLDGLTGTTFLKKNATRTLTLNGAATATLDMRSGYYRKAGTLLKAGTVTTRITVNADYR